MEQFLQLRQEQSASKETDLDEWEKYDEETKFPIKTQSIEEKALKEEIERTNQQSVNDLFKVHSTGTGSGSGSGSGTGSGIGTGSGTGSINTMKTTLSYTNYAKECSNKMKTNKSTSQNILTFCKTIIDENCLKISVDHLEELLEHIHKLKESKLFKPIGKTTQQKDKKEKEQKDKQHHEEIFGDCTGDFNEEHLRIENHF